MSDRLRILVVDDDPMFRSLLLSLLRKDYLVSVASDGSDGYHKALQYPPDVAIVDIQMPGWDGLKTLSEFRKHPSLSDIQIMMLTSDASRETVLAAIEAGANDYVIKTSFSKEEFYRKLDKLVASASRSGNRSAEQTANAAPAGNRTSDTNIASERAPADPVSVGVANVEDDAALQEMIDDWD